MPNEEELADSFVVVNSDEEEDFQKTSLFNSFKNKFMNITEGQIKESDLEKILLKFKNELISKNVAQEISSQICENIK